MCIRVKARGQPQCHSSGTIFLVLGVGIGLVWGLLFVVSREVLTGLELQSKLGKAGLLYFTFYIHFPSLDQISWVFSLSFYALKTVCTSFHMTGLCFLG